MSEQSMLSGPLGTGTAPPYANLNGPLSLRRWDVGQHGVWGGLVAAERVALYRELHANLPRVHGRGTVAGLAGASPTRT
jgi:hypothetical protein